MCNSDDLPLDLGELKTVITSNETAADFLLKDVQLQSTDAVRLIMELLEECPGEGGGDMSNVLTHCRHVIKLGVCAFEQTQRSVTFEEAVRGYKTYKSSVKSRTIEEVRQMCNRLVAEMPEWNRLRMNEISSDFCQHSIEYVFKTVPMRRKARRILHSLFSYARLHGWCDTNPLDLVVLPPYEEQPIRVLTIEQVSTLLRTSLLERHLACAPALGIMLWAGVRPTEILRLHQSDISFEDRVITIPAAHAKTGGARQVTMYPPLFYWLRNCMYYFTPSAPIVPRTWAKRWYNLRQEAGCTDWVPDILRHTFASYHLKFFKDLTALQVDMGHTSLELLRTRYLAMDGVTAKSAKAFWALGVPKDSPISK